MRLPTPLTAGVSAAAALVLLTACGGGSDDEVDAFCSEAEKVFTDLNTAFAGASNPTELPGLLQQATSALESIDPPAEIEGSWTSFSGALAQLTESAQGIDLTTTAGQAQFTQQYTALMTDTQAAQDDVDEFVTANCPDAAVSSPTS